MGLCLKIKQKEARNKGRGCGGTWLGAKQSKVDPGKGPYAGEENCHSPECDEERDSQATKFSWRRDLICVIPEYSSQEIRQ